MLDFVPTSANYYSFINFFPVVKSLEYTFFAMTKDQRALQRKKTLPNK